MHEQIFALAIGVRHRRAIPGGGRIFQTQIAVTQKESGRIFGKLAHQHLGARRSRKEMRLRGRGTKINQRQLRLDHPQQRQLHYLLKHTQRPRSRKIIKQEDEWGTCARTNICNF